MGSAQGARRLGHLAHKGYSRRSAAGEGAAAVGAFVDGDRSFGLASTVMSGRAAVRRRR